MCTVDLISPHAVLIRDLVQTGYVAKLEFTADIKKPLYRVLILNEPVVCIARRGWAQANAAVRYCFIFVQRIMLDKISLPRAVQTNQQGN